MLNLPHDEVHLWTLDSGEVSLLDRETEAAYVDALSETEARRYHRLQISRRKQQYLLGKFFVRQVLSRYRDVDPLRWTFVESSHGKPVLADESAELAFNLSHSRGMFAVAVSSAGVTGVDVEYARRSRRIMALANRHFSAAEIAALKSLEGESQLARFYQLWTLNEAFVKGRGLGLTMPLQDFTFEISDAGKITFAEDQPTTSTQWQFWTLPLASSFDRQAYTASLAVGREGASRQTLYRFEFSMNDEAVEKETVLPLASS